MKLRRWVVKGVAANICGVTPFSVIVFVAHLTVLHTFLGQPCHSNALSPLNALLEGATAWEKTPANSKIRK